MSNKNIDLTFVVAGRIVSRKGSKSFSRSPPFLQTNHAAVVTDSKRNILTNGQTDRRTWDVRVTMEAVVESKSLSFSIVKFFLCMFLSLSLSLLHSFCLSPSNYLSIFPLVKNSHYLRSEAVSLRSLRLFPMATISMSKGVESRIFLQ